jgi:hypothetical protein
VLFAGPTRAPLADSQRETTRSPHGSLAIPCENCHTATGWRPIRAVPEFDHNKTKYPLRGMHEKVPCVQCHVKPVFSNVATNCQDCHADVHQRKMGTDCAQCHTVQGWNIAVQQVKDHQNRFPLLGAHAAVQCEDCHKGAAVGQFLGLSTACNSCHMRDFQQATNPNHVAAQFPQTCADCHSFDSWLGATVNHSAPPINFPLTNGHANVPCQSCHVGGNYKLQILATDCGNSGCHLTTWQQTTNPKHSAAATVFPVATCAACHNTVSWLTANFDHSTTGFPLTNSHQLAPAGKVTACTDCHINNNYTLQITPTDCGNSGCHLTNWQQTNNPTHSSAGAPFAAANCSTCHNPTLWTNVAFDHSVTGWPLTGSHQLAPAGKVVACTDCHVGNNYTFTTANTDCYGCHQTAWNSTPSFGGAVPNHITAGFPTSLCSSCHDTSVWTDSTFNHANTGFPLTNSHQIAPAGKVTGCEQCHVGNYSTLAIQPTDCGNSGCHLTTWQQTNNPTHSTAGTAFAAASCSTCHNPTLWTNVVFNHAVTGWPLAGSHQMAPAGKVVACTDCHVGNNYTFTAANTDCYGCHQTAWNSTSSSGGNVPNHITAGFPTSLCSSCHDTVSWTDSTFNHAKTGFPLTNSHQLAPAGKVTGCNQCHGVNYKTLAIQPTDCGNSGCHLSTWQQTNNPTHPAAGASFGTANCQYCHNPTLWTNVTFNHAVTGWALTGSHQMAPAGKVVACTDCHVGSNYNFTAANTDCYGCHQTAWNSTPSFGGAVPNHISAGFPTSLCSSCHDTITWTDSTFNHANTGFPLTNSHQIAPAGKVTGCDQCHVGNYSTLAIQPTDCGNSGCHLTTWQGTNNPSHSAAGSRFGAANCQYCHNPTLWSNVAFDHSVEGWPLTGSHQMAPAGKIVGCTDCHYNNTFTFTAANTDCYYCHKAAWNSTASIGGNVPNHITAGFPTSLCSSCHDTVLWADGRFDHSTTGFPLQGPHMLPPRTAVTGAIGPMVNACTDCHLGANYTAGYPATDCYSCHQSYFTNAQTYSPTAPNHVVAGYPTTCIGCHTTYVTTAWLGVVFNHPSFRIPHNGSVCADCHISPTTYAVFSCISACHTGNSPHTNQTNTNGHHNGVTGYTYNATICVNCHKS